MTPYLNGNCVPGRKMLQRLEKDGADVEWIMSGNKFRSSLGLGQKLMISHYRTEFEQILRKAKYLSRELNEAIAVPIDAYAVLDHDTKIDGFSNAFEKFLDYPEGALINCRLLDLIHPKDRDNVIKMIEQASKTGYVTDFVSRFIKANGDYMDVEWCLYANTAPMSENMEYAVIARKVYT
ncbi:PAS domain-containing protein [Chlorobium phaeobacteroides]|nr:PAS domain-containing protein [Chlorobium phaeobacteroides]